MIEYNLLVASPLASEASPHDVMGTRFADVMIEAETKEAKKTADILNDFTEKIEEENE